MSHLIRSLGSQRLGVAVPIGHGWGIRGFAVHAVEWISTFPPNPLAMARIRRHGSLEVSNLTSGGNNQLSAKGRLNARFGLLNSARTRLESAPSPLFGRNNFLLKMPLPIILKICRQILKKQPTPGGCYGHAETVLIYTSWRRVLLQQLHCVSNKSSKRIQGQVYTWADTLPGEYLQA